MTDLKVIEALSNLLKQIERTKSQIGSLSYFSQRDCRWYRREDWLLELDKKEREVRLFLGFLNNRQRVVLFNTFGDLSALTDNFRGGHRDAKVRGATGIGKSRLPHLPEETSMDDYYYVGSAFARTRVGMWGYRINGIRRQNS